MGKTKICDRCGKFYLTNIDGNERTFTYDAVYPPEYNN